MSEGLGRLRELVADGLDHVALLFWRAAHRLRPIDTRPRCPDCRIGPDVGDNCPVCAEHAAEQDALSSVYDDGYHQGYVAGERDFA